MSRDRAFEAENGFLIENGPFITGGANSPVGAATATAGDLYIQNSGSKPIMWQCIGPTISDWRQLGAQDIPFDNSGLKFNSTTIQGAVVETQDRNIISLETLTTSLNGNHNISTNAAQVYNVIGTAAGYSLTMPNATNLFIGRRYEIANNSNLPITIKNNSGITLATLVTGDLAVFTLQSQPNAAGVWLVGISTNSATGITSYVVTSDSVFSTTSTTDTIITGFTVTPDPGRYSIYFSANITIAANNALAQFVVFRGGSVVANTRRLVQGVGSNFVSQTTSIGEVSANGTQAVDIRVRVSAGTLAVTSRSLILVRLGAS